MQTGVSVAIALPVTFAITMAWFGGDLSQNIDGWRVLRFALGVATTESLIICPLVAFRGVILIRTINNLRDHLHSLASRDPLTNLLNRRGFDEGVASLPTGGKLAVLVGDLDHFKRVNDRYGHDKGDEVLKATAGLLRALASERPATLLARLGGEEFVVALGGAGLEEARLWADKLRVRHAAYGVGASGGAIFTTLSIGVAATDHFEGDIKAVMSRADAALYYAKRQGRNRVETDLDPPASVVAA